MLCVGAATTNQPGHNPNWDYKVVQGMVFGNESKLEDGINNLLKRNR